MNTLKAKWGGLSTPIKILIIIVGSIALYFGGSSLYINGKIYVQTKLDTYADARLQSKNDELQAKIDDNNIQIAVLGADNIKLKAEREAMDKELETIRVAIRNDGKIVESEQKKIDEANKKYNDTKDSCTTITDPNAYVQCVCAKLGVECSS